MGATRNKRRHFQCGHTGHGRWCHRCEQAKALAINSREFAALKAVRPHLGGSGKSKRKAGSVSSRGESRDCSMPDPWEASRGRSAP